ncbi:MAG: hypothetical protein DMG89_06680 [Acidobacteria bacterium]|nr:MAG: hypothetical protein DMG89_06680 [Acidobacteriota bacterium]
MATAAPGGMLELATRERILSGAFFWLSAFYFVYCARPEEWIPGLHLLPLAKISGLFALLGLLMSLGRSKRGIRDLPKEAIYLLLMIGLLVVSALFSPIWRGGAFFRTLDFGKVLVAWILTFLCATDLKRLRRLLYIQTVSVAFISVVSVLKGRSHPRLEGAIGGMYSNPNDLAFAIVLSLPFCLAFLLGTESLARKLAWMVAMLMMVVALVLTASRGGFITFVVAGTVSLWYFAVKGRRPYLIVVVGLIAAFLFSAAGGQLAKRFLALSGEGLDTRFETSAYGSFEQRRFAINKSLEGIAHHPLLGIGVHNFPNYSGVWIEVHVAYLQIAVEGGLPVLVLYLLFFWRGFSNLRKVRRIRKNDPEIGLLVGALHSSLIGFLVGAAFAPEAYQYFPYFTICYTAVLLAIVKEEKQGDFETERSNRTELRAQSIHGASDRVLQA